MSPLIPRLFAALLLWNGGDHALAAALPPAEAFFENANFTSPKLSPDGRYLAARTSLPGERYRLTVVKLDDMSTKVVAMFSNADVRNFDWVNDERLVFDTADKSMARSDDRYAPGLFAVNRDGSGYLQLAQTTFQAGTQTGSRVVSRALGWNHFLLGQHGLQNSDSVYVTSNVFSPNYSTYKFSSLGLLNTLTGHLTPVKGPGEAIGWQLDQNGTPRIAMVDAGKTEAIYYRDGDGDDARWRKISEFNTYTGTGAQRVDPVGFAPDGTFYVSATGGADHTALYRYDLAAGAIAKQALVTMDGYDFEGGLVIGQGKLLGVTYEADTYGVSWFDAGMKALQAKVDTLMPGRVNLISRGQHSVTPWVLIHTYSDIEPGSYVAYNTDTQALIRLGQVHDKIKPEQMGRQELVHYQARDGLEIPAWVTYPHGSDRKNLPLVMLVHGGPNLRGGSWGWNPDAQFLASRGYAVMEPEYRGSTGFGYHHFHAGWRQWGLKMQDDVADGAQWAIAKGIADGRRVCIAGASYGGYAVLMGLVNDPGLYKCGVDWAGVTDINLMYSGAWSADSDLPDRWKQYGMPELIGDQVKDAAQLKATSPLEQAARIRQPLLLAYGTDDQRVPLYHGEKFYAAVKAGNPNVEWITYEKEGHGWELVPDRIDFWTRVEKFLAKNIGPQATPAGSN